MVHKGKTYQNLKRGLQISFRDIREGRLQKKLFVEFLKIWICYNLDVLYNKNTKFKKISPKKTRENHR